MSQIMGKANNLWKIWFIMKMTHLVKNTVAKIRVKENLISQRSDKAIKEFR